MIFLVSRRSEKGNFLELSLTKRVKISIYKSDPLIQALRSRGEQRLILIIDECVPKVINR